MHNFNLKGNLKHIDIVDEFLCGWCGFLQEALCNVLPGAEPYEIFENTPETRSYYFNDDECDDFYWNDHQVVKWKGKFIDIRGIFNSEDELVECHKRFIITKEKNNLSVEDIDAYVIKCHLDHNILEGDALYLTKYAISAILNDEEIINMFEK